MEKRKPDQGIRPKKKCPCCSILRFDSSDVCSAVKFEVKHIKSENIANVLNINVKGYCKDVDELINQHLKETDSAQVFVSVRPCTDCVGKQDGQIQLRELLAHIQSVGNAAICDVTFSWAVHSNDTRNDNLSVPRSLFKHIFTGILIPLGLEAAMLQVSISKHIWTPDNNRKTFASLGFSMVPSEESFRQMNQSRGKSSPMKFSDIENSPSMIRKSPLLFGDRFSKEQGILGNNPVNMSVNNSNLNNNNVETISNPQAQNPFQSANMIPIPPSSTNILLRQFRGRFVSATLSQPDSNSDYDSSPSPRPHYRLHSNTNTTPNSGGKSTTASENSDCGTPNRELLRSDSESEIEKFTSKSSDSSITTSKKNIESPATIEKPIPKIAPSSTSGIAGEENSQWSRMTSKYFYVSSTGHEGDGDSDGDIMHVSDSCIIGLVKDVSNSTESRPVKVNTRKEDSALSLFNSVMNSTTNLPRQSTGTDVAMKKKPIADNHGEIRHEKLLNSCGHENEELSNLMGLDLVPDLLHRIDNTSSRIGSNKHDESPSIADSETVEVSGITNHVICTVNKTENEKSSPNISLEGKSSTEAHVKSQHVIVLEQIISILQKLEKKKKKSYELLYSCIVEWKVSVFHATKSLLKLNKCKIENIEVLIKVLMKISKLKKLQLPTQMVAQAMCDGLVISLICEFVIETKSEVNDDMLANIEICAQKLSLLYAIPDCEINFRYLLPQIDSETFEKHMSFNATLTGNAVVDSNEQQLSNNNNNSNRLREKLGVIEWVTAIAKHYHSDYTSKIIGHIRDLLGHTHTGGNVGTDEDNVMSLYESPALKDNGNLESNELKSDDIFDSQEKYSRIQIDQFGNVELGSESEGNDNEDERQVVSSIFAIKKSSIIKLPIELEEANKDITNANSNINSSMNLTRDQQRLDSLSMNKRGESPTINESSNNGKSLLRTNSLINMNKRQILHRNVMGSNNRLVYVNSATVESSNRALNNSGSLEKRSLSKTSVIPASPGFETDEKPPKRPRLHANHIIPESPEVSKERGSTLYRSLSSNSISLDMESESLGISCSQSKSNLNSAFLAVQNDNIKNMKIPSTCGLGSNKRLVKQKSLFLK